MPSTQIAACVGTKELVGTLPQWLRLRRPDRDTVLHPAVACPTYEMGPRWPGAVRFRYPWTAASVRLGRVDPEDAARALVLWVNSPANPTGALDDLAAGAGRTHGVPVFSDECYCEFTWTVRPRSSSTDPTAWSPSTRCRSGRTWPASRRLLRRDAELVAYLQEVRKHVGLLVPGPGQAAGVVALDDEHVEIQRERYRRVWS